jgi:hypothetical protein
VFITAGPAAPSGLWVDGGRILDLARNARWQYALVPDVMPRSSYRAPGARIVPSATPHTPLTTPADLAGRLESVLPDVVNFKPRDSHDREDLEELDGSPTSYTRNSAGSWNACTSR